MKKKISWLMMILFSILLTGCATVNSTPPIRNTPAQTWAVLPFMNLTETPLAGKKTQAMTASLMQSMYRLNVKTYTRKQKCDQLLTCPTQSLPMKQIRVWARQHHVKYALTGSVNEWQYKVGLDGTPAASFTLKAIDLKNNRIIWSSTGSETSNGRVSVSYTAQQLLTKMLGRLY